jgi:hypothetical protein
MHGAGISIGLAILMVSLLTSPARADVDLYSLYDRLEPGMTVEEVAAAADGELLRKAGDAAESWLLWTSAGPARATAVMRATFREGRLVRLQYEEFGDEYRRFVKGRDSRIEIDRQELRRLWERTARLERVTDDCQVALEAYHRLVLGAQERLTRAEQASWVRVLELRRETERRFQRIPK